MMIGERNHPNPTVHVPPWTLLDNDLTDNTSFHLPVSGSPISHSGGGIADYCSTFDSLTTALRGYLPSTDLDLDSDDSGSPLDASYSCDQFRMYEFKVRQCTRGRSHDWTDCPYAHPGEKARRRDPRKYNYLGTPCPDFRKGSCKKGDDCEFAHGVFECWLHPARYRTQPCKDGLNCRRRVCFFAHSPDQLRVLSPRTPGSSVESFDESPHSHRLSFSSQTESAPMSPVTNSLSRSLGSHPINDMVASLRQLQLNKVKTMPYSWAGVQIGVGSPRVSMTRAAFCSLPSTPTMPGTRTGIGFIDQSEDEGGYCEEEPAMERVESGRDLRAKIFEKLSRENPLDGVDPSPPSPAPDVGWVSELVM